MNPAPRRHDLLRVAPDAWASALAAAALDLPAGAAATVAGWAGRGWPVVRRRRLGGEPPDALPVGVPLPPSLGKLRVALLLPPDTGWCPVPPPGLADLRPAAPASWHPVLDGLSALGTALGVRPRPFGSALWGAVTGLPYLGPGSDLDLLWPVTEATALDALLDGLARLAAAGPVTLDGEILLPDGAGVQWRELLGARRGRGGTVLAKTAEGLSLRPARRPWAPADGP